MSLHVQLRRFFAHYPPSAFLLGVQLIQLILYAIFDTGHSGQILISVSGMVVLIMIVWTVTHGPAKNWVAWVLAVPASIFLLLALVAGPSWLAWSSLFESLLYFYAALSLIIYMMQDTRVTTDELFATGATFTLLAWGFAYAYFSCQSFLPGSFISTTSPESQSSFLELLSFSFSNITATGLSDILPVSPPGRVLMMLTQFVGVGYVALVVSRLISMTITRRPRRKEYDSRQER